MFRLSRTLVPALALLAVSATAARAQESVVLDFEALGLSFGTLPSYSEDGFTFTSSVQSPAAFAHFGRNNAEFAGSTGLYNLVRNTSATLTRDDGRPFSLTSIDLAETYYGERPGQPVRFTGVLLGGGTVTQSFTLDGINLFFETRVSGFETFTFGSEFTNLTAVTWQQGSAPVGNYFQFDNVRLIVAAAIPEPGTLALAATGLLPLVGAVVRKRRCKA